MRQRFTATVWEEPGGWHVAQCPEVEIASQGHSPEEALRNLAEALGLHFAPPCATVVPEVRQLEVGVPVA